MNKLMVRSCVVTLQMFLLLVYLPSLSANQANNSLPKHFEEKIAQTAIPFVRNHGQLHEKVAFRANTFGGQVFVTNDNALVYDLPRTRISDRAVSWRFREVFVANRVTTTPTGIVPSRIKVSQFKGRDAKQWKQQLLTYNVVSLGEQFPGITVNLKATGNNIEKLFYVASGANPETIKLRTEGVSSIAIDSEKQLVLATDLGNITFTAPVAYQVINGKQHSVKVAYTLKDVDKHEYGFKVGEYDPGHELIIDPLLASTYVGGVNANIPQYNNYDQDIAYSVLVSGDSIYIAGVTQSTDFPVLLGYDDTPNASGWPDGFIARFSSDLSTLYSSTYFGTENFDRVSAIAMDTDGNIVATGQAGYGFPVTPGAYNYAGVEPVGGGFVAKFSADLSTLIASAVVTPGNYPTEIAIGNAGIYFAGSTNNPNFPITPGAFLSTCCPQTSSYGARAFDGFAGKISTDLSTLNAMTYLGGEKVTGIAVAPDSSVYITDGGNGVSGFIAHFDADLSTRFSTIAYYPGTNSGSSRHYFEDVAVGDGYVVAVGTTYLNDLPVTTNVFDSSCGTDGDCNNSSTTLYLPKPDGFIARYSLDLQTTQALTYFGGSEADAIHAVEIDSQGNVHVAGTTTSPDMPTSSGAHDNNCGSGSCDSGADIFVAKLSPDLSQLAYGTYLGGSASDYAYDLSLVSDSAVVVTGYTSSADFPTTDYAFDTSYAGGASGNSDTDAFISVIDTTGSGGSGGGGDPDPDPVPNEAPIADAGTDQVVGSRARVKLDGSGSIDSDGVIVRYRWSQVAGRSVRLSNIDQAVAEFRAPRLRGGRTYTLVFEIEVTDDQGAVSTDQVTVEVR